MDLGAYAQIEDLGKIMEENGISIPRLRGLRLMKDEKPVTKEELDEMAFKEGLSRCEHLCRCKFDFNANWGEYSDWTDFLAEYYLDFETMENFYGETVLNHLCPTAIRWDRVHGKKRKAFKYVIKKAKKEVYEQFKIWNKYAGQDNVLYIHCRLGAGNWNYYRGWEIIEAQPWYLDHVENYFDSTYIDVYAKIKEVK